MSSFNIGSIDAGGSQFGDHNTQTNNFNGVDPLQRLVDGLDRHRSRLSPHAAAAADRALQDLRRVTTAKTADPAAISTAAGLLSAATEGVPALRDEIDRLLNTITHNRLGE